MALANVGAINEQGRKHADGKGKMHREAKRCEELCRIYDYYNEIFVTFKMARFYRYCRR